jgi:hypothetical protein
VTLLDLLQRSSTFLGLRIRATSSISFSTFVELHTTSRHSSTFADILWLSNSLNSTEFVFDFSKLSRTSPTLSDLILVDFNLLELSRLSNSRDWGDQQASAGRVLHRVSGIGFTVSLGGVSGLWLGRLGR